MSSPLLRNLRHNRDGVVVNGQQQEQPELVGFSCLPDQVHRKSVKKGFEFTLMVVGETGLGKSTLVNSLFIQDLYKDRKVQNADERIHKTTEICQNTVEIEEQGIKLRLTVVDTPGYGDAVNNETCWKAVSDYIDTQYEHYFKDESGLNRKNIVDNRVHCCLYFISPYGHGLKPLDILFMKELHCKVNIVPVIAKADNMVADEIEILKRKVMTQITDNNIKIYQFPDCDSDEDEDFKQENRELKAAIPFAVIGSNTVVEVNKKRVRGRIYPWGIIEVDNPKHSDFVRLRNMLIRTHMQDLKDVTRDVHYENFRSKCITSQIDSYREKNKLKRESTTNFDLILEADRKIQEKDQEIQRMQHMLARMQQQMNHRALETDANNN